MQLSRLFISNLAFTRAKKMEIYLILASETDPTDISSHFVNGLVLHDFYYQAALCYPEASMEYNVYNDAAAYVQRIFTDLL